MVDVTSTWTSIMSWLDGPARQLAISFAALFVVVEGLELGLSFVGSYIERRRNQTAVSKRAEWLDEYNNGGR